MACIGHAYTFRQQTCAIMQVSRAYAAISVGTPMACNDISHFSSHLCATKSPNESHILQIYSITSGNCITCRNDTAAKITSMQRCICIVAPVAVGVKEKYRQFSLRCTAMCMYSALHHFKICYICNALIHL